MRTSDDGDPLVHRVETERDVMVEARLGLDQLLKKAVALRDRDARERAARLLEDESAALQARRMKAAQALAERFEWKPVASVGLFECQVCSNCGSYHYQFRGWATRMERKADKIKRLAAAPCLDRGLPYERELMTSTSQVCSDCIQEYVGPELAPHYAFIPHRSSE